MSNKKQESIADEEMNNPEAGSSLKVLRHISLPPTLTVKQLADLLKVSAVEVIKQLMRSGVMANINQAVDYDTAAVVVAHFGYEAKKQPISPK